MFGLSLTKNLKAEQEKALADTLSLEAQKAELETEQAALRGQLTEAKGLNRFKIVRLTIDIDHLESHLRGMVYPSLWIESESLGRKIVLIAYADKVLSENHANAIQAHFPIAERL